MSNNNNMTEENEIEIDLSRLLKKLLSKLNLILISTFSVSLIFILITMFLISPKYESRVSLYVNVTQEGRDSINMSEINASKSLVDTYMTFIKSNRIMNKVLENFDEEEMALKQLKNSIECTQISGTEFFEVKVKTDDPLLSAQIAEYISKIAPIEFQEVFKSSNVVIVDNAKVPVKACEPNVYKNALLGAILGFIIMTAIISIKSIYSQTVEAPSDIEKRYDVPLIGTIPDRLNTK